MSLPIVGTEVGLFDGPYCQIRSVDDALTCFLLGETGSTNGIYRIERTPPCLVLHLLQFSYDRFKKIPFKITKRINFSRELSLDAYDMANTVEYRYYELYAVGMCTE